MPQTPSRRRKNVLPRRWLVAGIVVVLLLSLGIGGVVLFEVMKSRRLHHYIQWGDEAITTGQFSQATVHYSNALKMTPSDVPLQIKLADAFDRAGQPQDGAACWQSVLTAGAGDNAVQYMNRLLDDDLVIFQLSPSESAAAAVKRDAATLAAAQPDNRTAVAYAQAATLLPWLAGDGNYTDDVAKAAADLTDLARHDPENLDALRYAAWAGLNRATTAHASGHDADAAAALAGVSSLCADLIAAHPDKPGLNLDAAQILSAVSDAGLAQSGDTAQSLAARTLAQQAIHNALDSATTADPLDDDITLTAATIAAGLGDPGADSLFQSLIHRHPDSLQDRLAYSRFLSVDPDHYPQAADLLSPNPAAPITPAHVPSTQPTATPRTLTFNTLTHPVDPGALEIQRIIALARLRVAMISTASDQAQSTARIAAAQQALADATAKLPTDSPATMMLKAQLDGAMGRLVQAIQDADKAVDLLKKMGNGADADLIYNLAEAYVAAGQSQQAQASLQSLLDKFPGYWPARFMLARLLLRDNLPPDQKAAALAQAARIIDTIQAALPNDPRLPGLLAELDVQFPIDAPKRSDAADQYAKIPESTRIEKLRKADIALAIGQTDDVVRLLTPLNAEHPDDGSIAGLLVNALDRLGKTAQARAVVAAMSTGHTGDQDISSLLNDARVALAQTNIKQAADLLTRARTLPGDQTPVTEALLTCALAQKDWTAAESYAQTLSKQNADQADGLTYRVRIDLARELVHQAVTDALKLKDKIPDFSGSWALLGLAYQGAGDFDNAAQSYAHALNLKSSDADSLKGLIECDEMLGRQDDAWATLQTARRLYPDDAEFRRIEADHELKYGDAAALITSAQAAVSANPNDPSAAVALARADLAAAVWQQTTDPAAATAKINQARQMLLAAVARWPDDLPANALLANADLQAAQGDAGLTVLTHFADQPQWRNRPEPQMLLADYLGRIGKPDDAIAAFRRAYAASSNSPAVARELASALAGHNKVDEALALLRPLAADDPNAQRQIVDADLAAGRLADAEQFARSLLVANPNSPRLLGLLSWTLMRESQFDPAATELDHALALDPTDPALLYQRGILRLALPKPDLTAAVADLVAARDINPADPEIRLALANAYRLQHDNAAAISELQTALPLAPYSKAARLALIDLYAKANPPQWDRIADLTSAAEQLPALRVDPTWSRMDARMGLARGDLDLANSSIHAALKLGPDDPDALRDALDVFLQKKDYPAALATADHAIALAPQSPPWWALLARAQAHSRAGNKSDAATDFTAALTSADTHNDLISAVTIIKSDAVELGKNDALARIAKRPASQPIWKLVTAQILASNHDPAAIGAIDALLKNVNDLDSADRPAAFRLAADLYSAAAPPQLDKVQAAYKSLLALDPDDINALNNFACLLLDTVAPPRPQDAVVYAQHAYDLMQKSGSYSPAVADTYGWALVQTGQSAAATDILKTAAPQLDMPDPHYHLAEALLGTDQPQDAQTQLQQAQTILDRERSLGQPTDPILARKITAAQSRAAAATAHLAAAATTQSATPQANGGN